MALGLHLPYYFYYSVPWKKENKVIWKSAMLKRSILTLGQCVQAILYMFQAVLEKTHQESTLLSRRDHTNDE